MLRFSTWSTEALETGAEGGGGQLGPPDGGPWPRPMPAGPGNCGRSGQGGREWYWEAVASWNMEGKGVERVERVAGHQHGRQGAQLAVAGQELGHERLVLERVRTAGSSRAP